MNNHVHTGGLQINDSSLTGWASLLLPSCSGLPGAAVLPPRNHLWDLYFPFLSIPIFYSFHLMVLFHKHQIFGTTQYSSTSLVLL